LLERQRSSSFKFLINLLRNDNMVSIEVAKKWIANEDISSGIKHATVAATDILLKNYEENRNVYEMDAGSSGGMSRAKLLQQASRAKLLELQSCNMAQLCVYPRSA
jgi:hypothetical protein